MKYLQELFTTTNPSIRAYPYGHSFHLLEDVALVTDGTIAVEMDDYRSPKEPVTMRIAGADDFLNLDLILSPSTGQQRVYTVESEGATVSLLKVSFLRGLLELGDDNDRLRLYRSINQGLINQLADVSDSFFAAITMDAGARMDWAMNRLQETQPEPTPLSRARLASHTFLHDQVVTRQIKTMREEGRLCDYREKLVTPRQPRRI